MDGPLGWDFEGQVTFLDHEDGGLSQLPKMGYFPSFRYRGPEDARQFLARPVAGFRSDGRPYDEGEPLDSAFVAFRFRFLDRDRYEALHRPRLVPGRPFDLMEGHHRVACGIVGITIEAMPPVQMSIERLVAELGAKVPPVDAKDVLAFLHHGEWECAVNLLWAVLSVGGGLMEDEHYRRLVGLARQVGMDLLPMQHEFPIRHAQNDR